MNIKLFFEALIKYLLGVILVGILIFVPAGTLRFFNGWLLMVILFVPIFIAGIVMMIKSPELLKRRLDVKERESEQKDVLKLCGLMFLLGFIVAGLDYRFNWLPLPSLVSYIASVLFIICYVLYAEILRENVYLSRTIKVEKHQKIIDTGLYAIVRHPMYLVTIVLFLSMPLILGSVISFIIFMGYPFIIVKRILNEETVLEKELKGYKEYKDKVKYRLIPYIW